MNLYGHDIELTDQEGEYVTDVMVIARVVRHDSYGRLDDGILISCTDTTTGMLQRGMLSYAEETVFGGDGE